MSGPVTCRSALAARLAQSDKSNGVGRRVAGWLSRNSDDAPPRQLGVTGRARCVVRVGFLAERITGMATTSCSTRSAALAKPD